MNLVLVQAATIALALGLLAAPAVVDAHGYVLKPKTVYAGQTPDGPTGEHDSYKVLPPPSGVSYDGKGTANSVAFKTALQASKYKSLKEFILAIEDPRYVPKCAGTAPQTLPDKIEFGYPPYNIGFMHEGPCEMWCDNTRVMADDNCAKTYGVYGKGPAMMTYDKEKCVGAKEFTYYWLNVDGARWQPYINCAALSGQGGNTNNNSTSPSRAPTPTQGPSPSRVPSSTPSRGPAPTSAPSPADAEPTTKKPKRCARKSDD
ncbi:hypothetical protein ATCC90586_007317 [Pythium insidiosum]|nr:hypothetical protein ATCC90586_007317 [Pythium insidiosum]